MKKTYKRILAATLASILVWNTCEWQPRALAGSKVYQIEEVKALPESVPREFRVPALRAARNRREQQLKIVGDRAATMAWQLHARACMEVLGFGPDRLNRLYDEMRHNYDQMNTWGKEDGIDVAMERMRKCACDALKTDDIVVEDVEDSKELAA